MSIDREITPDEFYDEFVELGNTLKHDLELGIIEPDEANKRIDALLQKLPPVPGSALQ